MNEQGQQAAAEDKAGVARQQVIAQARRYYRGEQGVQLTERQREFLGFQQGGGFRANYCRMVVNAVHERLIVSGFSSDEAPTAEGEQPTARWAARLWRVNRGDALQFVVHRDAVRDGEVFVLVDPTGVGGEAAFPVLAPHPRYVDPRHGGSGFGIRAYYDNDDPRQGMQYVAKWWTEEVEEEGAAGGRRREQRQRMTLYFPERIERYVWQRGARSGWVEYREEGQAWPVAWMDRQGRALGIPVIHFQNPEQVSELADAVPVQDAINKTLLDIIAAADACGIPVRWSNEFLTTDGRPPADDGSNYLAITPGCIITVQGEKARLENLEGGDLGPLLQTYNELVLTLARITDTPLSRFQTTRQVAAEGTLKQQEAPLLSKVRARQVFFGNAWEDVLAMARRLAVEFGGLNLAEDVSLETQWAPAETRDEPSIEEKLKAGVPQEQVWAEMGYTQEEIGAMKQMDEVRARQAQRAAMLELAGGG